MITADRQQQRQRQPADPRGRTRAEEPIGNVLLLFQPDVGGVPHYVANLAEGLAERGWGLSVGAPSNTPVSGRLQGVAHNLIALDTGRGPSLSRDLRVIQELLRVCRQDQFDVIHAHSSKAGALAAVIGGMTGIPSVYTPHAWSFQRELPSPAVRAFAWVERMLARRHAHVVAVADAERAEAQRHRVVDPGRIQHIHTGIRDVVLPDGVAARERLRLRADGFVVGWVGRSGAQKRSEQLPTVVRELGSEARLVALGHGIPESEPGRELARLGATVTESTSADLIYAAADALAMTSRWEGLPLVVLEAMRASLPVVSYDIGGVREQVDDGVTGYLVEPGDAPALAARLLELARDPERAKRMGRAGRDRFLERFDFGQMIDSVEGAYRHVMSEDTGRGANGHFVQ